MHAAKLEAAALLGAVGLQGNGHYYYFAARRRRSGV